MKFAFIRDNRGLFDVEVMCAVFAVTAAGFYAWLIRPDSPRALRAGQLAEQIRTVHHEVKGVYGSIKITRELRHRHVRKSAIKGSVSQKSSTLAWRPFPVGALPTGMGRFVTTVAKSIGCDPAFVGLPALVVCAAAIGNTQRILLKAGWTEPCVLWGVIVGDSGSQKSPAIEPPLKPLRKWQAEAIKDYKRKAEVHRFEVEQYKGDLQEWKSKGRKKGELQPSPPREPACERYICQESTVEALADRLRSAPRGILICRDELSA